MFYLILILDRGTRRAARSVPLSILFYEKNFKKPLDFLKNFLYTLRIESERLMRTEQEVQEEQRKAEARVQRWNESVQQVRDLAQAWQRDNRRWQSEAANRERWEQENGRNLSR